MCTNAKTFISAKTKLKIRVPQILLEDIKEAAVNSNMTISEWCIAALDVTCGLIPLPPLFRPRNTKIAFIENITADAYIGIRVSTLQQASYFSAAIRCFLPFSRWAMIILAIACGASDLPCKNTFYGRGK